MTTTTPATQIPPEGTEAPAAETPAAPEPTLEQSLSAALDEGVAEATPEDVKAAAEPAKPAADPVDAKKPDEAEPAAAPEGAKAPAKPEAPKPDEAVEGEIAALGLKEKSAARFRELAGEVKELAPIKEALAKTGVTDVAAFVEQLPQLQQRSKDFEDLVGMVSETGATPEQYDMTLQYLADVNAAKAGDVEAAQRAYDRVSAEVAAFAQLLGKEAPGVDPLAQHPDLVRDIEAGDLSRERALEIAQARTQGKLHQNYRQQATQRDQTNEAMTRGKTALDQLGVQLRAQDGDYARKEAMFIPMVRWIVQNRPPEQWAQSAQEAYATIPAIPAPAPAPAPTAKPAPGPMRASGPRPMLQPTTDDPMEALDLGIAAASG